MINKGKVLVVFHVRILRGVVISISDIFLLALTSIYNFTTKHFANKTKPWESLLETLRTTQQMSKYLSLLLDFAAFRIIQQFRQLVLLFTYRFFSRTWNLNRILVTFTVAILSDLQILLS